MTPDFLTPAGFNLQCTDPSTPQCQPCQLNPNPDKNRRRRYEVRDMPKEEWDTFVFCTLEMKNLSMEDGITKYGELFKTMDYYHVWHAVVTEAKSGNQGHFGAHLMSWHGAFVAAMEQTLLACARVNDMPFEGMPYWYNLDASERVFSDEIFGTHPGKGDLYQVNDGPFANWSISMFDIDEWVRSCTVIIARRQLLFPYQFFVLFYWFSIA